MAERVIIRFLRTALSSDAHLWASQVFGIFAFPSIFLFAEGTHSLYSLVSVLKNIEFP